MTPEAIMEIIRSAIGTAWGTTNDHRVDLRTSLVPPKLIPVIERSIRKGIVRDRVIDVWLVLVETSAHGDGYRIVAKCDGTSFGLASKGFPSDEHLVLNGWHGDFMTAFRGM